MGKTLEVWRGEIDKMISHCPDIEAVLVGSHAQMMTVPPHSQPAAPTSDLNGATSTSTLVQLGPCGEEHRALKDAGQNIISRLRGLRGKYDERIRDCRIAIDGMVLALQMVRPQYLSIQDLPRRPWLTG